MMRFFNNTLLYTPLLLLLLAVLLVLGSTLAKEAETLPGRHLRKRGGGGGGAGAGELPDRDTSYFVSIVFGRNFAPVLPNGETISFDESSLEAYSIVDLGGTTQPISAMTTGYAVGISSSETYVSFVVKTLTIGFSNVDPTPSPVGTFTVEGVVNSGDFSFQPVSVVGYGQVPEAGDFEMEVTAEGTTTVNGLFLGS